MMNIHFDESNVFPLTEEDQSNPLMSAGFKEAISADPESFIQYLDNHFKPEINLREEEYQSLSFINCSSLKKLNYEEERNQLFQRAENMNTESVNLTSSMNVSTR